MQDPQRFAASLLENGASGYAAAAVGALSAEQIARFGEDGAARWRTFARQCVQELAVALRASDVALFTQRVAWHRQTFCARQLDDLLVQQLLCSMRETLAEELPAIAAPLVDDYLARALEDFAQQPPAVCDAALDTRDPHQRLALRYLLTVLEGDPAGGIALISGELERGALTAVEAYVAVLLPAQREVGRRWLLGELTIAEEHLVSETTRRTMGEVMRHAQRAPRHGRVVVLAAVAGEAHGLALRATGDLLELAGWRALSLGVDLPSDEIAQAVSMFSADLLVLSVTMTEHLEEAARVIRQVRALDRVVPVILGGAAILASEGLGLRLGADAVARTVDEAVLHAARCVDLGLER
jgi:methanogenic corrinoid protein MtbC1